jgi:hypothetical protein
MLINDQSDYPDQGNNATPIKPAGLIRAARHLRPRQLFFTFIVEILLIYIYSNRIKGKMVVNSASLLSFATKRY